MSRRSVLFLECTGDDGEVLVAEPPVDHFLPFVRQQGKRPETILAGRLQGEVHVLERQRQSELNRIIALGDSKQLGRLPGRHKGAAIQSVDDNLGFESQPTGQRDRSVDRLRCQREPGVSCELQSRPRSHWAHPYSSLAQRIKKGAESRTGHVWP